MHATLLQIALKCDLRTYLRGLSDLSEEAYSLLWMLKPETEPLSVRRTTGRGDAVASSPVAVLEEETDSVSTSLVDDAVSES